MRPSGNAQIETKRPDLSNIDYSALLGEFEHLNVSGRPTIRAKTGVLNPAAGVMSLTPRDLPAQHRVRVSDEYGHPCTYIGQDVLSAALIQFLSGPEKERDFWRSSDSLCRAMTEHGLYKVIGRVPTRSSRSKLYLRSCRGTGSHCILRYYLRKCGIPHTFSRKRIRVQRRRTWVYHISLSLC